MSDIREDGFLERLGSLKETGIMNGGFVTDEDIASVFPELSAPQKDALKS